MSPPHELSPEALPFAPLTSRNNEGTIQDVRYAPEQDELTRRHDAAPKQIISLQARQAELSALIVNQQRASTLPSQEPPVFNGSHFDYPTFIAAFEAMIDKKVDSGKDRLNFFCKYTSGKAHEVVKGFFDLGFGQRL